MDVVNLKVLGAFCLIDEGELDWKVFTIDSEEARQKKVFFYYNKRLSHMRTFHARDYNKSLTGLKFTRLMMENLLIQSDSDKKYSLSKKQSRSFLRLMSNLSS